MTKVIVYLECETDYLSDDKDKAERFIKQDISAELGCCSIYWDTMDIHIVKEDDDD